MTKVTAYAAHPNRCMVHVNVCWEIVSNNQPHDAGQLRAAASDDFLEQLFAISRVGRMLGAEMRRRIGLHRSQVSLLNAISRRDEVRLAELANEHQVDPSVISRQIMALEQEGLIARRPDPADRRAALLRLTDEGSTVLDRAFAVYRETALAALEDWSTTEIQQTADALRRIITSHAPTTAHTSAAAAGNRPQAAVVGA